MSEGNNISREDRQIIRDHQRRHEEDPAYTMNYQDYVAGGHGPSRHSLSRQTYDLRRASASRNIEDARSILEGEFTTTTNARGATVYRHGNLAIEGARPSTSQPPVPTEPAARSAPNPEESRQRGQRRNRGDASRGARGNRSSGRFDEGFANLPDSPVDIAPPTNLSPQAPPSAEASPHRNRPRLRDRIRGNRGSAGHFDEMLNSVPDPANIPIGAHSPATPPAHTISPPSPGESLTKDIRQGMQSIIDAEAAHHAAARKKEAQAAAEAAAEQAELDSLNNAGKFAQRLSREKGHDLKITRLADESNYVVFPALINSFSDSFQSSWNPESVYGRMDPIMTFQNTQRAITVGFRIVGEDRLTMIKNQTKLSQLIKLLYPGYKGEDNNKYLAIAPLVRVQFANYIPNLVCAIGGLDYTPTFDETNAWIDYENSIAPTYFDLSLTLTVLHEHTLGFDEETDNKQFFESDTFGYGTDNSDDLRTLEKQLEAKMGNLTGPPPDAADEINLTRRQRRRLRRRERRGPQDLSRREARELGDRELLKRGIDDYRKNTGGSYAAGLEQITGGGGRR